jgi:uncharacterized protein
MKKQILFIHSAGNQDPNQGSSQLVAYLQKALGNDYALLNPEMPDPENPDYSSWKSQVEKSLAASASEVILIGHSLGGSVLLKYLSEHAPVRPIIGLFVIAAPYWESEGWSIDEFRIKGDPSKLAHIPAIFFYHSRNDEWVPFSHLRKYSRMFPQATIRELEGNEHSFDKHDFPQLVADIKGLEGRTKI